MQIHFNSGDARAYGTDEAIFLHNVVHWVRVNRLNRRNCHDGRTWTYNTAAALVGVFDGVWSEHQIRRIINSLVRKGVLLKGNYNREAGGRADDRTLWLALADEARLDSPDGPAGVPQRGPAEPPANSPEPPAIPPEAQAGDGGGPNGRPAPRLSSGDSAGRLSRNRRRPVTIPPDASGEFAGCIKDQIQNGRFKTADGKQQQQLPYPSPAGPEPSPTGAAAAGGGPDGVGESGRDCPEPGGAGGRPPAVFPVVPSEQVQRLLDAGCTRADAEALVAEGGEGAFPQSQIDDQIAWLAWRNCESPRYWLPRYIREGWQKPKGLRDQEKRQADAARQRESGSSRDQEARRRSDERRASADRRQRYLDGLSPEEAEALEAEAHAGLLRGDRDATGKDYWRAFIAEKLADGKDYRQFNSYRQALARYRDAIIDEREGVAAMVPGPVAA